MSADEEPKYLLGDHGREVERLRKQHSWIQYCLKDQIVFAPIDLQKPGLKVLDVGCADGTVLRDLQKQTSPSAELVGADIMKSFMPESSQGNIRFIESDMCEPPAEELVNSFDLTHVRVSMAGAARVGLDPSVANLAATVAPGGWLQIQELDLDPDRPALGQAGNDFNRILSGMFDKIGMGGQYASKIGESMEKAGLTNVSVKAVEFPLGKSIENEEARRNSIEPFKITIPSITQAAKGLGVDLPESVFEDLPDRFEKEALEKGLSFRALIVVGQKPL